MKSAAFVMVLIGAFLVVISSPGLIGLIGAVLILVGGMIAGMWRSKNPGE